MRRIFLLLALLPVYAFAQVDKADEYYNIGRDYVKSHQFEKCKETWSKILALDIPADLRAETNCNLGMLCKDSLNQQEEAKKFFKASADLLPLVIKDEVPSDSVKFGAVIACVNLSSYADSAKNYSDMLDYSLKAYNALEYVKKTNYPVASFEAADFEAMAPILGINVAAAYSHLKRFDEAEEWFDKIMVKTKEMQKDPENYIGGLAFEYMVYFGRNVMYTTDKKDYAAGKIVAQQMVEQMSNLYNNGTEEEKGLAVSYLPMALFTAADACIHLDQYEETIEYCDKAMTSPNADNVLPFVLDTRGEAYLALGNEAEAKACWQMVKERVPSFYETENPQNKHKWSLSDKFGK